MGPLLSIAGSDCSAGAGIQADLKAFGAYGFHGLTAVTAVVAEVPGRVAQIESVSLDLLRKQLDLLAEHYPIAGVKTGMLADAKQVNLCAEFIDRLRRKSPSLPVVVDPVISASAGADLLRTADAPETLAPLLQLATVATPNRHEAMALTDPASEHPCDGPDGAESSASAWFEKWRRPAVVTGGHYSGDDCVDVLCDHSGCRHFSVHRIMGAEIHGTGCTFSSALLAALASGLDVDRAIPSAQSFTRSCMEEAYHWTQPALIAALKPALIAVDFPSK